MAYGWSTLGMFEKYPETDRASHRHLLEFNCNFLEYTNSLPCCTKTRIKTFVPGHQYGRVGQQLPSFWYDINFRSGLLPSKIVVRDEIKSSGKNSILNSFKIAGQTPSPLYSKGVFLMLTAAYNIKHNNVYEFRYRQKAFSM